MDSSPIAHVALLHTDIYSGFRLAPRTGMNSPMSEKKHIENYNGAPSRNLVRAALAPAMAKENLLKKFVAGRQITAQQ